MVFFFGAIAYGIAALTGQLPTKPTDTEEIEYRDSVLDFIHPVNQSAIAFLMSIRLCPHPKPLSQNGRGALREYLINLGNAVISLITIAILNDLYLTPVPSPVLGRRRLGAAIVFYN